MFTCYFDFIQIFHVLIYVFWMNLFNLLVFRSPKILCLNNYVRIFMFVSLSPMNCFHVNDMVVM